MRKKLHEDVKELIERVSNILTIVAKSYEDCKATIEVKCTRKSIKVLLNNIKETILEVFITDNMVTIDDCMDYGICWKLEKFKAKTDEEISAEIIKAFSF